MTTARDELAALIYRHSYQGMGFCHQVADAILAAGWRPPEFGRRYRTLKPDGSLWAETADPRDWYLAHPDPSVALTWQRITTDDDWIDWPDHPTDLVHPSTLEDDDA